MLARRVSSILWASILWTAVNVSADGDEFISEGFCKPTLPTMTNFNVSLVSIL
jgi:hypothetical protein